MHLWINRTHDDKVVFDFRLFRSYTLSASSMSFLKKLVFKRYCCYIGILSISILTSLILIFIGKSKILNRIIAWLWSTSLYQVDVGKHWNFHLDWTGRPIWKNFPCTFVTIPHSNFFTNFLVLSEVLPLFKNKKIFLFSILTGGFRVWNGCWHSLKFVIARNQSCCALSSHFFPY